MTRKGARDASPFCAAHLRDLRKSRFGGHTIHKRWMLGGLWKYQFVTKGPNPFNTSR